MISLPADLPVRVIAWTLKLLRDLVDMIVNHPTNRNPL